MSLLLALQIQNALTRLQKEQTVEKLERAFEKSAVVYGLRFKNLSVSLCPSAARIMLVPNEFTEQYMSSVCSDTISLSTGTLSGETNDRFSTDVAAWSCHLCVQKYIAAGCCREEGLGVNYTRYQGCPH